MTNTEKLVRSALLEDIDRGDVTTALTVPADSRCRARLVAKQDGVLSGIEVFKLVFECMEANASDWKALADGTRFSNGDEVASFQGDTRAVLTGERVAMNFVQHLSGVATLTAEYVEKVKDLGVRICDTRKTTPMMRGLEKAAVLHGGGSNHRHTLFDGILIKENHIMAAGGLSEAIALALKGTHHLMRVEVEVTNLDEFDEAVTAGAGAILLDNMPLDDMAEAVRRAKGNGVVLEASGNVNLERVRAIAETGVDVISAGALTHSAPAVDLSLRIENG